MLSGKPRAAWLFPVKKTNAASTSMSKPNWRAACENVTDLFFFKQWNRGGLPAATNTALGTSVCCLLESLILWKSNIHSSIFCVSTRRATAQSGHLWVHHLFCPQVFAFTCTGCAAHEPGTLDFSEDNTTIWEIPERNTAVFYVSVKERVGDATVLLQEELISLQTTWVLLQAQTAWTVNSTNESDMLKRPPLPAHTHCCCLVGLKTHQAD